MVARSTCDHVHAVDQAELLRREAELIDVELARGSQTPHQRVADHAGLLADLLHHEIRVAALLGRIDIPIDVRDRGLDGAALRIGVGDALRRKTGELAVLQHHNVARGVDERDDIRCDVASPLPAADDDRAVLARDGDHTRLIGAHRRQPVRAHHVRAGLANCGHEIARGLRGAAGAIRRPLIGLLDEMREHLGIRLALEHVPALLQRCAELGEILDDAVVDHRDAPVAAHVGMGVLHRGAPVGRPACMADPARREPCDRTVARRCELVLKTGDFARAADDVERCTAVPRVGGACGIRGVGGTRRFHEGKARGIISAVLETFELSHEKPRRSVDSGVSNDSAHKESLRSMNNGATF
ncbi:Uncharacterised protein [Collinsella intestinalis]|nr:Uncharacterised protein [Collinsella intestinalis]